MPFQGFAQSDFDIFSIPGLEARMDVLKKDLRPKLEQLGTDLAPFLSAAVGTPFYPHVAKHARRTVNPPDDTWVAWASDKRGYKKYPHFQVGMWSTHLFIWFALIYESPQKSPFAQKCLQHLDEIYEMIPAHFEWSWDHTQPETIQHGTLSKDELRAQLERVAKVQKAELLCGVTIDRKDPLISNGQALLEKIEETFTTLIPLYRLSL